MVTIPKCVAPLLPANFVVLGMDGYHFTLAIVGILGFFLSMGDMQRTKVQQLCPAGRPQTTGGCPLCQG